jgi:hypothetical protein
MLIVHALFGVVILSLFLSMISGSPSYSAMAKGAEPGRRRTRASALEPSTSPAPGQEKGKGED